MKINTASPILTYSGQPVRSEDGTVITLGSLVAAFLSNFRHDDKVKCFTLGQKFATQDEVDIDEADLALAKEACEAAPDASNLVTGQILVALAKVK